MRPNPKPHRKPGLRPNHARGHKVPEDPSSPGHRGGPNLQVVIQKVPLVVPDPSQERLGRAPGHHPVPPPPTTGGLQKAKAAADTRAKAEASRISKCVFDRRRQDPNGLDYLTEGHVGGVFGGLTIALTSMLL